MNDKANDLEDLKKHPAVLHLYTQRTHLDRCGDGLIGKCPIHVEQNASFTLDFVNGTWIWFCHGCKEGGSIIDFLMHFDKLDQGAAIEKVRQFCGVAKAAPYRPRKWQKEKEQVEEIFRDVVIAEQTKEYITYSLDQYEQKVQALRDCPEAMEWLLKERGLQPEVVEKLKLGYVQNIRGAAGKDNTDIADKGWIVMPYIQNEKVVLIKYRSIVRKAFARLKGMETTLFNIGTVDIFDPVFVTEGEFDAAVLEQAGFRAISLPSANVRISPLMKDIIMNADEVFLAGDNDGKVGSEVMEALWTDFEERSYLILWPNGCKDANETFLTECGGDVDKFRTLVLHMMRESRRRPMPNVMSLEEAVLSGEGTNLIDDPNRLRFPWPEVDKMAILLPGSVMTLFATNTGMGKTQWLANVTMYGAKRGERVLNYQCEVSSEEFATIAIAHEMHCDRNHITPEERVKAAAEFRKMKYFIGYNPNLTTVGPVLDVIEAAIRRMDITIVVLDHIHFICRNEENEVTAQSDAMQRIKNMARKHKVKFIVVAQPRKADKYSKGKSVHISDAKGSETLTSDADAVFALHREFKPNIDPNNPPKDEYQCQTDVRLLKSRSKGDGDTFTRLMFIGAQATFYPLTLENQN